MTDWLVSTSCSNAALQPRLIFMWLLPTSPGALVQTQRKAHWACFLGRRWARQTECPNSCDYLFASRVDHLAWSSQQSPITWKNHIDCSPLRSITSCFQLVWILAQGLCSHLHLNYIQRWNGTWCQLTYYLHLQIPHGDLNTKFWSQTTPNGTQHQMTILTQ